MKRILYALLLGSIICSNALTQQKTKQFDWEDGRIVSGDFERGIRTGKETVNDSDGRATSMTTDTYHRDDKETFTVETGEYVYVVQRILGLFWEKRIRLSDPVNVKYAIRLARNKHHHDEFLLLDARGKRISYRILEKKPKHSESPDYGVVVE